MRQQASMALGDVMGSRLGHSSSSPAPAPPPAALPNHHHSHVADGLPVVNGLEPRNGLEAADVEKPAPVVYLPQVVVLCEQRHEGLDEAAAGPSTSGPVSRWRPKDRVMDVWRLAAVFTASAVTQLFTGFGACSGVIHRIAAYSVVTFMIVLKNGN